MKTPASWFRRRAFFDNPVGEQSTVTAEASQQDEIISIEPSA